MTNEKLGTICMIVGGAMLIHSYGRRQYKKGRLAVVKDLTVEFEKLYKEIDDKIWKTKIQKAMAEERKGL